MVHPVFRELVGDTFELGDTNSCDFRKKALKFCPLPMYHSSRLKLVFIFVLSCSCLVTLVECALEGDRAVELITSLSKQRTGAFEWWKFGLWSLPRNEAIHIYIYNHIFFCIRDA